MPDSTRHRTRGLGSEARSSITFPCLPGQARPPGARTLSAKREAAITEDRHPLPGRAAARRCAIAGAILLGIGLLIAAGIAWDLPAANVRDLPVNQAFWDFGQQHPWVLSAAGGISWIADGLRNILIVGLVSIGLLIARRWEWAIFLLVCSQGGVLLSNALKFAIARERPPFVENSNLQQHLSFPSGHTFAGFTVWAAMALIAWYLLPRRAAIPVAAILLVIGLLQAPSRLIVGKHWLSDVVGSWFIGSGWLLLIWGGFIAWLASRPAKA
ncbi:MAG: phosphatase PAP2 family protein [Actinomycetales bacterium]